MTSGYNRHPVRRVVACLTSAPEHGIWGARMGWNVAAIYWEAARHTWRTQLAHADDPLGLVLVHATR